MNEQQLLVSESEESIVRKDPSLLDLFNAIQDVKGDTAEIKGTLNYMEERISGVEDKADAVETKTQQNSRDIEILQGQIAELRRSDSKKKKEIASLQRQNTLDQLYGRRMNILIHGQPDDGANETKDKSLDKIKTLLEDKLGMDMNNLVIVDGHRLPQKPKKGSTTPRPLVFKVGTI